MLHWFKKSHAVVNSLKVDIHSHLLPGIDDGVRTFEEAAAIIADFAKLGYTKLITTPHISSDTFRNTPEIIAGKLAELRSFLKAQDITVEVYAAAEYYLDESLVEMVRRNEPLLTLHGKYLLFETNFLSEPFFLKDFIFLAATKGYRLVLAHPERYLYLQNDFSKAEDLLDRGVLFQVNTNSLSGVYTRPAQVTAQKLIDRSMVHWLGSDCHSSQHMAVTKAMVKNKYFQKALTLPLLNNTLQ